ncbi:MAG: SsgA family sporulation/cell division regulator [Nocardioidaceae bacterium]
MSTSRLATQSFVQHLVVHVRTEEGYAVPVTAELGYDSSDPFAATLAFHISPTPVRWTFGRDLLDSGLAQPTGDGDVHVWPALSDEGRSVVVVELCSPFGDALVEMPAADTEAFIDRSHAAVAPGRESVHLDLDATIAAFWSSDTV